VACALLQFSGSESGCDMLHNVNRASSVWTRVSARVAQCLLILGASVGGVSACGGEDAATWKVSLFLVTDFRPGEDFDTVETVLKDDEGAVRAKLSAAASGADYRTTPGRSIAIFSRIATGTYQVTVTLKKTGVEAPVGQASVNVRVAGDQEQLVLTLARDPLYRPVPFDPNNPEQVRAAGFVSGVRAFQMATGDLILLNAIGAGSCPEVVPGDGGNPREIKGDDCVDENGLMWFGSMSVEGNIPGYNTLTGSMEDATFDGVVTLDGFGVSGAGLTCDGSDFDFLLDGSAQFSGTKTSLAFSVSARFAQSRKFDNWCDEDFEIEGSVDYEGAVTNWDPTPDETQSGGVYTGEGSVSVLGVGGLRVRTTNEKVVKCTDAPNEADSGGTTTATIGWDVDPDDGNDTMDVVTIQYDGCSNANTDTMLPPAAKWSHNGVDKGSIEGVLF
jgi:hypothetical protein